MFYKVVPTHDVTNPAILPIFIARRTFLYFLVLYNTPSFTTRSV